MIHCQKTVLFLFPEFSHHDTAVFYLRFHITERLESFRTLRERVSIFLIESHNGQYTREIILKCEGFLLNMMTLFASL